MRGRGEARDGRGGMGGARAEASCCGRSRGRALQVEWEGQYPVAMHALRVEKAVRASEWMSRWAVENGVAG